MIEGVFYSPSLARLRVQQVLEEVGSGLVLGQDLGLDDAHQVRLTLLSGPAVHHLEAGPIGNVLITVHEQ